MPKPIKSSVRLENRPLHELHAHDRLLVLLKTGGSASAAGLAGKLGITAEAVRQQLLRLQAEGLVTAENEIHGVGRPVQKWRLTPLAHQRFPDAHAELTTQLIDQIRQTLGEPALERLLEARAQDLLARYAAALQDTTTLKERLERLVSLRTAEGYMAEARRYKGGFLLIENHCPICAASGACPKFCGTELDVFSRVLGPGVEVNREEHALSGDRRCVYRIRQL